MRFFVCLSLISSLSLVACGGDSDSGNQPTPVIVQGEPQGSNTPQNEDDRSQGTVGNGGSVVDLPEGVALADTYYQAPDWKLPDFYIGRVENFDSVFPGVREEVNAIAKLLNARYGGLEILTFKPEDFEIYLTEKFSGNHPMPIEGGKTGRQVAYTFSFYSMRPGLTEIGDIHNIIELSPEIKSWPIRMQALAILHETLHHHSRLGMEEHFHSIIAPLIAGADIARVVQARQVEAAKNGTLDTLKPGEHEALEVMDRAMYYLAKGRLPRGVVEYLPDLCEVERRGDCQNFGENLFVRVVDARGGGVIVARIPSDRNLSNGGEVYGTRYRDWSDESVSLSPDRPDAPETREEREAIGAKIAAVLATNYVSLESTVELSPMENGKFTLSQDFWSGFINNVIVDSQLRFGLTGASCARNTIKDLSLSSRKGWVVDRNIFEREYPLTIFCKNANGNTLEDVRGSRASLMFALLGDDNIMKQVTIGSPFLIRGSNSVMENAAIYKSRLFGFMHDPDQIAIDSNVLIRNAVVDGGQKVRLMPSRDGNAPVREEFVQVGTRLKDVFFSGQRDVVRPLAKVTGVPAYRLMPNLVGKRPYVNEEDKLVYGYMSDISLDTHCSNKDFLYSEGGPTDIAKSWFISSTLKCIVHQFIPLSEILGETGN